MPGSFRQMRQSCAIASFRDWIIMHIFATQKSHLVILFISSASRDTGWDYLQHFVLCIYLLSSITYLLS